MQDYLNAIYKPFRKWFQYGAVYIYGDPHFADDEMIYLRHNYIGDEEQITSINKMVHKNDTIIFLGDIGDANLIKKIKGYKILIMGNHDTGESKYWEFFDEVYAGQLTIGPKIELSHEPLDLPQHHCMNIHGHDHSNNTFKDEYHLNVCAEWVNYTPVSLTKMLKNGAFKHIKDIHRQTIDTASKK